MVKSGVLPRFIPGKVPNKDGKRDANGQWVMVDGMIDLIEMPQWWRPKTEEPVNLFKHEPGTPEHEQAKQDFVDARVPSMRAMMGGNAATVSISVVPFTGEIGLCDCDGSSPCPHGKVGSATRCEVNLPVPKLVANAAIKPGFPNFNWSLEHYIGPIHGGGYCIQGHLIEEDGALVPASVLGFPWTNVSKFMVSFQSPVDGEPCSINVPPGGVFDPNRKGHEDVIRAARIKRGKPSAGTDEQVVVDPNGEIAETDDTNNRIVVAIAVGDASPTPFPGETQPTPDIPATLIAMATRTAEAQGTPDINATLIALATATAEALRTPTPVP